MADRYANNGAADIGFWFFQNKISLDDETADNGGFIGLVEDYHSLGFVTESNYHDSLQALIDLGAY